MLSRIFASITIMGMLGLFLHYSTIEVQSNGDILALCWVMAILPILIAVYLSMATSKPKRRNKK